MKSLATPLKNARGLGASKSGTEHFWQQRLTGLFNLPLMVFFIWFIVTHIGRDSIDVKFSLQNPVIAVLLLLTLASVFWHMRLGLQVVIEDYVQGHKRKLLMLIANTGVCAALFVIAASSILKMSVAS